MYAARNIFKDKGGFAEPPSGGEEESTSESNGEAPGRSIAGPIRTRDDAFRRLAEVAAFLRQREPQSPIYLLVERAVSWSRMPFDQLLGRADQGRRRQVEPGRRDCWRIKPRRKNRTENHDRIAEAPPSLALCN